MDVMKCYGCYRYIDKIKRCKNFYNKIIFYFYIQETIKKIFKIKRQHKQNKQKIFKKVFFLNITKQNKKFFYRKCLGIYNIYLKNLPGYY